MTLTELVLEARAEHDRLFATEGCDSPVTAQYEENLYRYAVKAETVQETPTPIANARAASDIPPGASMAISTSRDACLARTERTPADLRYCNCVGQGMQATFGNRELDVYLDQLRIRTVNSKGAVSPDARALALDLAVATSHCSR